MLVELDNLINLLRKKKYYNMKKCKQVVIYTIIVYLLWLAEGKANRRPLLRDALSDIFAFFDFIYPAS